ncbi:MAG: hypothetical protein FJ308_03190 [Planctomycetes bacterium]|nr:hypothetical protein [Planctomycetota bacterium]
MPLLSDAPDTAFVETLIRQGLAKVATATCNHRLSILSNEPQTKNSDAFTQWTMLAMHADIAAELEDIDWNAYEPKLLTAIELLDARVQSVLGTPREPWVLWKKEWCRRYLQQRALAAFLAVPGRESIRDWILTSIRQTLDATESLERVSQKLQPTKGPAKGSSPNITASQILDLRGDLELLKADLLYQRSQCYPPKSDDRLAAAAEMLSSIDRALQRISGTWSHLPLLRIARATAQLQMGQPAEAQKYLQSLWSELERDDSPDPESPQWKQGIASLAARAARESSQWELAQDWIVQGGGWFASPEMALEHFALTVAKNEPSNAAAALDIKRDIAQRFGPYWEQRADAILVASPNHISDNNTPNTTPPNHPSNSTTMASLEIFRIQVRQLLAAKKWREAIEKLQQAELAASQKSLDAEAFAFASQIAATFAANGETSQAADEFYRAAVSYPDASKAPATALMSAWLIRNPPQKSTDGNSEDLDAAALQRATYRERLIDTARRWPTSEPALQASDWLERELLNGDDWNHLLDFWTDHVKTSINFEKQSPEQIAHTIHRLLFASTLLHDDWLEPPSKDRDQSEQHFTRFTQAIVQQAPAFDRSSITSWLDALAPTPVWQSPSNGSAISTQLPTWIARSLPHTSPSSLPLPEKDPLGRVSSLWYACESNSQTLLIAPESTRLTIAKELGNHLEQLTEELAREPQYPFGRQTRARIDRSIAFYDALAQSHVANDASGIRTLESKRDENKKSLWWIYHSARTMQSFAEHRQNAIGLYRQMASGVPAGSQPWIEARARTVQTLRAIGKDTEADQLRDLVLATYPAAGTPWRDRFNTK